ncbi:MAG: 4Fe-4S dicluster domain-containing protein, partial [Deltaproteobacteria bacterium]|nr:4Fe-4S dicluster domain-containing protein [Deltaproteobacteria bacterium]
MGKLLIDTTKCNRDGICVAICPAKLFERKEKDSFPTHVSDAATICIDCYHCVAACPSGALTIGEVGAQECDPLA